MTLNLLVLLSLMGLLFPVGAVLWAAGASREPRRPDYGLYMLAAVALGVTGSLISGFGLQFGGAAGLYPALGELTGLAGHWAPLDPAWNLAGASGFFLAVGDDPGAYALFAFQVSMSLAFLSLIAIACAGMAKPVRPLAFSVLVVPFAWLVYPLAAGWTWGGGWLATLGLTKTLGHGAVDFGGAGVVHLSAGLVALAAALVVGRAAAASSSTPSAEPAGDELDVRITSLGSAGALAMCLGWLSLLAASAVFTGASLPVVIANGLISAAGGAAAALGYMGFTTGRPNGAMGARGLVAGLAAISAGAPFVSPPAAFVIGAVAGLLVCVATHVVARTLRLDDPLALISVHGAGGLWGLLAVGVFATGRAGAGWNGMGLKEYLGVTSQGVTGLLAAGGLTADPRQMQAQMVGALAIAVLVFCSAWLLLKLMLRPAPVLAAGEPDDPPADQAEA